MPKPSSLDLRERVVRFVEAGHSRHAAAANGVCIDRRKRAIATTRSARMALIENQPQGKKLRSMLSERVY